MKRLRRNGGSVIIAALILIVIAVLLAAGMLSQRVSQKSSLSSEQRRVVAESIAWSGLEDARIKLMKSPEFPEVPEVSEARFSYTENLEDDGGEVIGRYMVQVDSSGYIISSAYFPGEEKPILSLRGILDGVAVRQSRDINDAVRTESRPFHWLSVEVQNYETAAY